MLPPIINVLHLVAFAIAFYGDNEAVNLLKHYFGQFNGPQTFLYTVRHPEPAKHRRGFAGHWSSFGSARPDGAVVVAKLLSIECGDSSVASTASATYPSLHAAHFQSFPDAVADLFWNEEFFRLLSVDNIIPTSTNYEGQNLAVPLLSTVPAPIDIHSEYPTSEEDDNDGTALYNRHALPSCFRAKKVNGKVRFEIWVVAQVSVAEYIANNHKNNNGINESELRSNISNDLDVLLDSSLIKEYVLSEVAQGRIGVDFRG
ncbi:hypothetical protein BX616_000141 [Lobosporangium transversale]|uniref:HNH nuclease domain-containing protein n=1 Tax=Lobosporangium transversale TaxID=64571 RepID=A0A1Y2H116_9FUNG|nr:hypothetical protein BCR41DRAFT_418312 [Lobosporangium transversale]KAF9908474.1 hypothetical protein BX616_000141 [Lobosporangium transversale]ORZ28215.1 hypothetical protein BCR41DRAFT_418312 [Lobosporangium transversale]|eukprot:XP_021885900.1 hypothetical protein BCR41DRAFT_418312 [Lobosporangium transversale]